MRLWLSANAASDIVMCVGVVERVGARLARDSGGSGVGATTATSAATSTGSASLSGAAGRVEVLADPVELPVALPAALLHEVEEHAAVLLVVGLVEEVERAHVLEVLGELVRVALAEHLDGRVALRVAYLLVALLERVGLEALPRQRAAQEVHEHVPERLQVVAPTLLLTQVRVDAHVTRRARQRLVLAVRDVFVRLRVDVRLRQAEVDYVDDV